MAKRDAHHVPPESGTPFPAEDATLGPLEREAHESGSISEVESNDLHAADGELPVSERQRLGIEDNVRHTSSLGRR